MKADTLNLKEMFRKDAKYVVPTFQRPYVWNEEEHWNLLWNDLEQVVMELIERREDADEEELGRNEPLDNTTPLFLGAMVLDQRSTQTSKLETREVIDGQQRLITLQVLLSSARSVVNQKAISGSSSMFEKLIFNDRDIIRDKENRFKVKPIEADLEAFRRVIDPELEIDENSGHALKKCHTFFVNAIKDWLEEDEVSPERKMEALSDVLWGLIRIVVIDLEEKDDSQVIFETLNARGTPLLAGDLIKNYLFREARRKGKDVDRLNQEYWEQFDEEEWRQEVTQGRLERPRMDVFIMHWLTMRKGSEVRAKRLFKEFQNYVDRTEDSIEEILQDIDEHAEIYKKFSEPYADDREGVFLKRLEVMDTTTPLPLLMWLYDQDELGKQDRSKIFEALESWMIRRMLCRLTTKNYNRVLLDLLQEIKSSNTAKIAERTISFLRDLEGQSEYWPEDEELRESMRNEQYWSRINQRRLRMVFRALEREMRDKKQSESLSINEKLHIEHILPQEWAHNWELPGERPEPVEKLERDEKKNTIGNLTVLTEELNPSLSNSGWEKKRDEIKEHSVLLLNREICENWYEQWDEDRIEDRAERLANIASSVWKSPESNYWDNWSS